MAPSHQLTPKTHQNHSGQPIYNDFYMTLFNVVFTAMAPLVVGWFDRDLDKVYGERFPLLYREGALRTALCRRWSGLGQCVLLGW
jgi:magnesium-transporting ATPase (P-type)